MAHAAHRALSSRPGAETADAATVTVSDGVHTLVPGFSHFLVGLRKGRPRPAGPGRDADTGRISGTVRLVRAPGRGRSPASGAARGPWRTPSPAKRSGATESASPAGVAE
ncbi:hypothetical protein ACIP4W_26860 [Streptomyces sp. NPDC088846]|uniref:hypothetical protein n=1 Tax=Streptomyces sp. NPDC088846 TaxID=3365908 RepID=UPI0037F5B55A